MRLLAVQCSRWTGWSSRCSRYAAVSRASAGVHALQGLRQRAGTKRHTVGAIGHDQPNDDFLGHGSTSSKRQARGNVTKLAP